MDFYGDARLGSLQADRFRARYPFARFYVLPHSSPDFPVKGESAGSVTRLGASHRSRFESRPTTSSPFSPRRSLSARGHN